MKNIGAGLYISLAIVAIVAALIALMYSFVANVDTSGNLSGAGIAFTALFGGIAWICIHRARQISKEKTVKENNGEDI
jgi:hypothetical protein